MTIDDFFNKWQLLNNDVDIIVLLNFMVMLDYLYCSMTEEQLLELVSDYYKNADDIYNSIVCNTKNNKYQFLN